MIDGFRPRRRVAPGLRPADSHLRTKIVVGDHSSHASASFKPPEQVAAEEEQPNMPASVPPEPSVSGPRLGKFAAFRQALANLDKKQWAIIIGVIVLLIGGGIGAFFALHKEPKKVTPVAHTQPKKVEPPKPTTEASKMTGLQVNPAVNQRPVTAIMIENSTDARPQSALDQADVVFEAIAEGGITRFLTLWHDNEPDYIGPVRSVRPYYIQWAMGFDAPIAHVGGSTDGLALMRSAGAKDLDQFAGGAYFHRIASRAAPHNVYTSIASLREYENKKGYTSSNFTGFARKAAEQPSKPGSPNMATSIDFTISSSYFNPHYDYDSATNTYKRSEGGAPHMEVNQAGAQTQIAPKVVIALVFQQGQSTIYTTYNTLASGKMFVFQDGTVAQGIWRKDSNSSQFVFTNNEGAPLKLNPGQTWLSAVGDVSRVAYK